VADRLLVDLGQDGRVAVWTWLEGQIPQCGEPYELEWPLDDDAAEDLRWYLEDYLLAPYGVWADRGPQVAAELVVWGQAVFSAVFGSSPAREAYAQARDRESPLEIVFRSPSSALLGLPWELMADPRTGLPLAVDTAGVCRSLPAARSAETLAVPGGRLRVLIVIARPMATRDVAYQMVARPLLGRLEAVRGQVDLVVLRPPTLDSLREVLTAAAAGGEPFQIVHFDGHGAIPGLGDPAVSSARADLGVAEGILAFEKVGGGFEYVPASRIAYVLVEAKVPVVVLNACQSGAVGKDLSASIAARLLAGGVVSVVAMAYSVYAVAAAEFMAVFYERLFSGDTITAAVTAARQQLYRHDIRPTHRGNLPLADWIVPVHYLRGDVRFPQARTERSNAMPSLEEALDVLHRTPDRATEAGTGDLDAVGSFVGRDDLFYELEVAARLQKVVVIHGPSGTGKTEFAKAFGRWWRDTGGTQEPEWVFWHSFARGSASGGLDEVLTPIGVRLFGADFTLLSAAERRGVLRKVLTERRMLLIWDNFEAVRPAPALDTGAESLDAGRAELREFLDDLARHGHSAVLITSRGREDWLGHRHIALAGLNRQETAEYAGILLSHPSTVPRREGRAFGELLDWLDGHPLSMRLILPGLAGAEPDVLLTGLRDAERLTAGETEDGQSTRLPASVACTFARLGDTARRLLPVACLFDSFVDASILAILSADAETPERFRGVARGDWADILEGAAREGVLTRLGGGRYGVHPALTEYLDAWWRSGDPENYEEAREAATGALLAIYAAFGRMLMREIRSGDASAAFGAIHLERLTMSALLDYAHDHGLLDEAQAIAAPLEKYWEATRYGLSGT
jgi:CHAT domain/NACHT domain